MPPEASPAADLVLRQAEPSDLPAVAEVHLCARDAAGPAMPRGAHPPDELRQHVAGWDLDRREVWVAEQEGRTVGYAVVEDSWLDSLYVHPDAQGHGVGSALLDLVKGCRPAGFCLWVFESNQPARDFYRRHGLVELERTDGSGNEEQAPDIRMAWPGTDPVGCLRGLVDEVDEQLGDLLARRVALTRAIQPLKHGAGRDPAREAQIARAVAARAPELGLERVARIMHVVIAESLDAVTRTDH